MFATFGVFLKHLSKPNMLADAYKDSQPPDMTSNYRSFSVYSKPDFPTWHRLPKQRSTLDMCFPAFFYFSMCVLNPLKVIQAHDT